MQKKASIKPPSRASEKVFDVTPSRMSENVFWNVGQTLHSSKVIPNVIYFIVLYSINIIVEILSSSRY